MYYDETLARALQEALAEKIIANVASAILARSLKLQPVFEEMAITRASANNTPR